MNSTCTIETEFNAGAASSSSVDGKNNNNKFETMLSETSLLSGFSSMSMKDKFRVGVLQRRPKGYL